MIVFQISETHLASELPTHFLLKYWVKEGLGRKEGWSYIMGVLKARPGAWTFVLQRTESRGRGCMVSHTGLIAWRTIGKCALNGEAIEDGATAAYAKG